MHDVVFLCSTHGPRMGRNKRLAAEISIPILFIVQNWMPDPTILRIRTFLYCSNEALFAIYRICLYRSRGSNRGRGTRGQVFNRGRVPNRGRVLNRGRSRIVAGSRTGVRRESNAKRDRYPSRSTRLRAKLVGNLS